MGRRNSRVELDPERAPLITMAFEEYAANKWSLKSLAEHLADIGLATPVRPKLPAKPINKKMLHDILTNPYYKGIVLYNDVEYQGKHEAIINEATWDKVQKILNSHVNGERTRVHVHYLKSTVYCGKCGARLIIHNAKSRTGDRYPYFVCSAKHNKRNDCTQRSLLIDDVADKIAELYQRISFTTEFKDNLKQWVNNQVDNIADDSKSELERYKIQQEKLEREQRKLLQAHYADAIPLDLLKEEQDRIVKSLKKIASVMESYQVEYAETSRNFNYIFELLDDCGFAYGLADDSQRRCFNQALFDKIKVYEDLTIEVDYTEPFEILLEPGLLDLKHEFEKGVEANKNGQSETDAHLYFFYLLLS